MIAATVAPTEIPRRSRPTLVASILVLLSGPIALVAGSAYCGADPIWVILGARGIFAAWGACIALGLWRRSGFSRALRALSLAAILVLAVAGAWIFPNDLFDAADIAGEYVHFALHRGSYARQVAAMGGGPPRLAGF